MTAPDNVESEVQAGVCYRHPDRPSGVRCQRCGRYICGACQTPAPVGVQCPECVREGRADAAPRPSRAARWFRPGGKVPIVTYTLIAINLVIFGLQLLVGNSFTNTWLLDPRAMATQPWRLLTGAFLHSPAFLLHVVFNMYALFILGPVLEEFLGRIRFTALYLIGALGGSVLSVAIYQLYVVTDRASGEVANGLLMPAASLGASGAIFGLMGAYLVLRKQLGVNLTRLLTLLAINFAITFFASGIAWEAHVGGFLTGMAVAGVYLRTRRQDQRNLQVATIVGIALALLAIVIIFVVATPYAYH